MEAFWRSDVGEATENMLDDLGDDVFFFCPTCGKSMVIDSRGAGLLVDCPACSSEVLVPDESEDEPPPSLPAAAPYEEEAGQQRIASLSAALKVSESDMSKMATSLSEMSVRRETLEQQRTSSIRQMEGIAKEVAVIQTALNRIVKLMHKSESDQPCDV